tara:strand:- start:1123 stop:1818 length:696 start_codon:yes stop_codon:yes gene_type:complete
MHAIDVMTTEIITVSLVTTVKEIAGLLLKHRISAVPVVDGNQYVLGIVCEGDLMCRLENDTNQRHSWWMAEELLATHNAETYLKTHGRTASDVMTPNVISVEENTPLHKIAELLGKHHIKRVPVTREGRLVGLVSRANLLHGLTAKGVKAGASDTAVDRIIRKKLIQELTTEAGLASERINVIVYDGVVQIWGIVRTETEIRAAQIAAESIEGVKSVENHLQKLPPYLFST